MSRMLVLNASFKDCPQKTFYSKLMGVVLWIGLTSPLGGQNPCELSRAACHVKVPESRIEAGMMLARPSWMKSDPANTEGQGSLGFYQMRPSCLGLPFAAHAHIYTHTCGR